VILSKKGGQVGTELNPPSLFVFSVPPYFPGWGLGLGRGDRGGGGVRGARLYIVQFGLDARGSFPQLCGVSRKLLTIQTDASLNRDIESLQRRTGLNKSSVVRLAVATLAGRGVVGFQWTTAEPAVEAPELGETG